MRKIVGVLRLALPIALIGLTLIVWPGVAQARVRPGTAVLKLMTKTVAPSASAAVTVRCSAGQRAITGGAYWHKPGENGSSLLETTLESTAPSADGRGWFATGENDGTPSLELTVSVQCLANDSFAAYATKTRDVVVDAHRPTSADVRCPAGTKVVMGGATWHKAGHGPAPLHGAALTQSAPDVDGRGWSVGGRNDGATQLHLTANVYCLKTAALGAAYHVQVLWQEIVADRDYDHYLFCDAGQRVLGGGAYWGYHGGTPPMAVDPTVRVVGSTANGNGLSWYTAVHNSFEYAYLYLIQLVVCVAA